jgi:proline dehydrogenase
MAFLRAVIRCSVYRKYGISGFYLSKHGVNSARVKFSIPPASVDCVVLKSTHAASAIGYDTEVEGKSSQQHPKDPLDLTFEDHVAAFKSKTTWEILRAYIVYTICSYEYLVEHNMTVRKMPYFIF